MSEEQIVEDKVETEDKQEKNWREVRSQMKAKDQKLEELEKKLEDLSKPKPEPEKDEFEGIDPNEYATVEMIKNPSKEVKRLKKEISELKQSVQTREAQAKEQAVRSKYPDYDYVVENYAIPLIKKNPAMGAALHAAPNWAEMAYNMAKATPEYVAENAKQETPKEEAEKVERNISRPTSASAVGLTLKDKATSYAHMTKAEIWAANEAAMRLA